LNGVVVARQNPSINADTGEVRAGTPSVDAVQQANGSVLIRYNAADPFSPGGEGLAKGSGISVNGTRSERRHNRSGRDRLPRQ
jgi:hypothetical protein